MYFEMEKSHIECLDSWFDDYYYKIYSHFDKYTTHHIEKWEPWKYVYTFRNCYCWFFKFHNLFILIFSVITLTMSRLNNNNFLESKQKKTWKPQIGNPLNMINKKSMMLSFFSRKNTSHMHVKLYSHHEDVTYHLFYMEENIKKREYHRKMKWK